MQNYIHKLGLLLGFILLSAVLQAAYTSTQIDSVLNLKAKEIPALNEKVSISVADLTLDEFLRGVANSSGLNLDVQPGLTQKVVNNFNSVVVKDVLLYICRQYNLTLEFTGNIISVVKVGKPQTVSNKSVMWNEETKLVTLDFSDTPIELAVKEITVRTGYNVILAPGVSGKLLNGYIAGQPVDVALDKLAMSNDMKLEKTEDNFLVFQAVVKSEAGTMASDDEMQERNTRSSNRRSRSSRTADSRSEEEYVLEVQSSGSDLYSVSASNAPLDAILDELSKKAGFNYLLSTENAPKVTIQIKDTYIDNVLQTLLKGSDMGYRVDNQVYLFGDRTSLDFNENKVIALENRSVVELVESIPETITKNLTLVEFPELNSIFVSGPAYQLIQFETFINDIDKVVPVVLIEVIIMYVNKSFNISTGIQAGIGEEPVTSGGTIFPDVNLQIGAPDFNRMLNDAGLVNLGKVKPNFYLTLRALEDQGLLEIESTPKLATINGHEANLSIGNTEYYLEEQTHLYGTQNPQQTTSKEYKAINAELSVKIIPVVSANEHITLEIEVHQSDFTERISETSPPGSVNRDFTSKIRVKDQEMIMLGGLLENRKSDSGSGVPFLSRIPIIKWLFSSRISEKSDSKLSVLIKPTIIN